MNLIKAVFRALLQVVMMNANLSLCFTVFTHEIVLEGHLLEMEGNPPQFERVFFFFRLAKPLQK